MPPVVAERAWGALSAPETHEIEALFARLAPEQHEEAARLGRRWARVALNEAALEEPPPPGTRAAGQYHVRLQSWCRALGMCVGALAVARRRTAEPAAESYGTWTPDPQQPRCPLCGVQARWSAAHTGMTHPYQPVRVNCMDGEMVSRRFPGIGPACPWRGSYARRYDDGRIVLDPPRRQVPDTLPPEAGATTTPFDLDSEVLP